MDSPIEESSFKKSISKRFFGKSSTLRNSGENPKQTYDTILKLLVAYEELDRSKKTKKIPLKSTHSFASLFKKQETTSAQPSLANIDFSFTYHLLNLTLGELYSIYQAYCKHFDQDSSMMIEEKEFDAMLDFLCLPDNMGKVKVRRSFEIYSPEDFKIYNKLALVNPSSDYQLEPFLKKGMFTVLAISDTKENSIGTRRYIHYLKFFPILFSYFAEFLKQRVELRANNMETICGLDSHRKRIDSQSVSFLDKLEHLGCVYNGEETPTLVSFSLLEKALILFRNNYSDTFGQEQLRLLLKEIQQKCQIREAFQAEAKEIPLTYKLLRWIAYRICLHCSLYLILKETTQKIPKLKVLEEYTVWAAAYNQHSFDKQTIERKFKKFMQKSPAGYDITDVDSKEAKEFVTSTLSKFCRNLIPHISDQSIEKMYELFCMRFKQGIYSNVADSLTESIYDIIIDIARNKLMEFIEKVHKSVKPDTSPKPAHKNYQRQGETRIKPSRSNFGMSEDSKHDTEQNSSQEMTLNHRRSQSPLEKTPNENKSPTLRKSVKGRMSVILSSQTLDILNKVGDNEDVSPAINRIQSKADTTSISIKQEKSENAADKIIDEAIHSHTDLDVLVEPSLRRKRSSSCYELPETTPQNSNSINRPSIFSQIDVSKIEKRNSSLDRRKPGGVVRLDMSMISQRPDDHLNIVRTSSIRAKLLAEVAESNDTGNDAGDEAYDRLYNKHTKRKVDIMNSYFIIESFLKKVIDQRDKNPNPNPEPRELSRERSTTTTSFELQSPALRPRGMSVGTPKRVQIKGQSGSFSPLLKNQNEPNTSSFSRFKRASISVNAETKEYEQVTSTAVTTKNTLQTESSKHTLPTEGSKHTLPTEGSKNTLPTESSKNNLPTEVSTAAEEKSAEKRKKMLLKKELTRIQDRKKAYHRRGESLGDSAPKTVYNVQEADLKILKNYDISESDNFVFKRREGEKEREWELCGTKQCNIF